MLRNKYRISRLFGRLVWFQYSLEILKNLRIRMRHEAAVFCVKAPTLIIMATLLGMDRRVTQARVPLVSFIPSL